MVILLSTRGTAGSDIWFMCLAEKPMVRSYHLGAYDWTPLSQNPVQICNDSWFLVVRRHNYISFKLAWKCHNARQRGVTSTDDARRSCAPALALTTRCPITCRRLGFRSGCCKYVEQCKTAIYWDLALDFTLVRLQSRAIATNRLIFSTWKRNSMCSWKLDLVFAHLWQFGWTVQNWIK